MSNFVTGDRVVVIATGVAGEVTSGFYWRDAQGRPPSHGAVPVSFDDGSQSYVAIASLTYEGV